MHSDVVPFSLNPKEIDYFKIRPEYLGDNNVDNVIKTEINLSPNQYLRAEDLTDLDLDRKEAIVFNFQTGKGKTNLCYDLIEKYLEKDYTIIVCSPFIKLVNKDYAEIQKRVEKETTSGIIKGRKLVVSKYSDANDVYRQSGFYTSGADQLPQICRVHIMTINCLLGNPGENAVEQNFYKKRYLENILDETEGKDIVLFLDEVHDSVHNFSSVLIPNLLKWKGRVKKVFISSATYSPATIPVIRLFSLLTDKKIRIFESDRIKNPVQANIHLHIIDFPYSAEDPRLIAIIRDECRSFQSENRPFNIITGTKRLAEVLCDGKNGIFTTTINSEKASSLDYDPQSVNLLTGDTNSTYKEGQNNVGTTFKTGVNITDNQGVLFIIFPALNTDPRYSHYGIFQDGVASIEQAVGRLRNGGDIHIFISLANICIGEKEDRLFDKVDVEFAPYRQHNDLYFAVINDYRDKVMTIKNEIHEIESELLVHSTPGEIINKKEQFGFWYPNQHEYLIEKSSQVARLSDNPSFGRLLSPYVLWACINDQFINATLRNISRHYSSVVVEISLSNCHNVFLEVLESWRETLITLTFRAAIDRIKIFLGRRRQNNEEISITYLLSKENGNSQKIKVSDLLSREPNISREMVKALYSFYGERDFSFDKLEYINCCINLVEQIADSNSLTDLQKAYRKFDDLKTDFLNWFDTIIISDKGRNYISADAWNGLPTSIIQSTRSIVKELRDKDFVIKNKIVSLLQNGTELDSKKTYTSLKDLFCNVVTKKRKQINGQMHYEVTPQIEFSAPSNVLLT